MLRNCEAKCVSGAGGKSISPMGQQTMLTRVMAEPYRPNEPFFYGHLMRAGVSVGAGPGPGVGLVQSRLRMSERLGGQSRSTTSSTTARGTSDVSDA
jgi:hypothetical protein